MTTPLRLLSWWDRPIAGLDIEGTTGDARTARPVAIALLMRTADGAKLPGSVETIVNTGDPIDPECVAVHGITAERAAAEGRDPIQVMRAVAERLEAIADVGIPLAIMNARFDWPLLHLEARRTGVLLPHNVCLLDPGVLDRQLDRYRPGKRRLHDLAHTYGVPLHGAAHDSSADAAVAIEVTRAIARAYPAFARFTLQQLQQCQAEWFAAWRVGINRHWANVGNPNRIEGDWPWGGIECGQPAAEQLTLLDVPAPRPAAERTAIRD